MLEASPLNILVLPLCIGLRQKALWDPVIERFEKHFASRSSRYLSFGGLITLIKSVLASLLVYLFSCFKCPKLVACRIEKIQWDFLWNDCFNKHKYHLVH